MRILKSGGYGGVETIICRGWGGLGPDIYLLPKSSSCCWLVIVGGAGILRNVTVQYITKLSVVLVTMLHLIRPVLKARPF